MGTAAAFAVGNILFMNWYYCRRIGLNIRYFWENILSFVPALAFPCLIGIVFLYWAPFDNWLLLTTGILVYISVYLVSMWRWGMNQEEKQMLLGLLHRAGRLSKRGTGE